MKRFKYFLPAILIAVALMASSCKKGTLGTCPAIDDGLSRSEINTELLLGTWEETYYVSFDIVDGKSVKHEILSFVAGQVKMELFDDGTFKTTSLYDGDYYISTGEYVYNDSDTPSVTLTYDKLEDDGTHYTVEFTIMTLSDKELTFREERIPGTPTADKWRPTRYMVWDMHYTRIN